MKDKNNFFLFFVQIDELYEAYCLQRRLRDGANKMVKAYTASQVSKEAKESLAEANKGYKEYTEVGGRSQKSIKKCSMNYRHRKENILWSCQRWFVVNVPLWSSLQNMCVLENELENQLGEFHIKMKGRN